MRLFATTPRLSQHTRFLLHMTSQLSSPYIFSSGLCLLPSHIFRWSTPSLSSFVHQLAYWGPAKEISNDVYIRLAEAFLNYAYRFVTMKFTSLRWWIVIFSVKPTHHDVFICRMKVRFLLPRRLKFEGLTSSNVTIAFHITVPEWSTFMPCHSMRRMEPLSFYQMCNEKFSICGSFCTE